MNETAQLIICGLFAKVCHWAPVSPALWPKEDVTRQTERRAEDARLGQDWDCGDGEREGTGRH